jgi:hypothetical protein
MESMAANFFKDLYMADSNISPDHVIELFQPLITDEMNEELCKDFTKEEISNALF